MRTKELKIIIDTAEQLGYKDLDIFYENGRDGKSDLTRVKGEVQSAGTQQDPHVILVFKMTNV